MPNDVQKHHWFKDIDLWCHFNNNYKNVSILTTKRRRMDETKTLTQHALAIVSTKTFGKKGHGRRYGRLPKWSTSPTFYKQLLRQFTCAKNVQT